MAQQLYFIVILWLSSEKTAFSKSVAKWLQNQHLIITGEHWDPFLYYDINTDENGTTFSYGYGGIMWDLLLLLHLQW